jgi:hypothetical protein
MAELTADDVRRAMAAMNDRCHSVRAAGGIPLYLVVDALRTVPVGWVLDPYTDYFVPPNLHLNEVGHG